MYHAPTFFPPTCLSLWERWQAERPDGEGACVVSCIAFSKYATPLPSQSQALRACASSPKESAKGALRAPVCPSTLYHPLASPFGGGGTANAVTERVLTFFVWETQVKEMQRRYPLSHGPCGPVPARCGAPGRGSDGPPDRHSLPRLRFAHPQRESQVGRRKIGRAPKESAKGALRAPVCPSTLYHPLACPIGRAKSVGGGSGRGGRSSTYRLDFSAQPGYDSFKERSVKGGASYAR